MYITEYLGGDILFAILVDETEYFSSNAKPHFLTPKVLRVY
jgi:hypothetical protein